MPAKFSPDLYDAKRNEPHSASVHDGIDTRLTFALERLSQIVPEGDWIYLIAENVDVRPLEPDNGTKLGTEIPP
jgi:hypothetical protein